MPSVPVPVAPRRSIDRFHAALLVSLAFAFAFAGCQTAGPAVTSGSGGSRPGAGGSAAGATEDAGIPSVQPPGTPAATPLANPPATPAGDGTTATIRTRLGDITIELFTESSPVAAENFINLAEAGFFDGVAFHRLVPGFVIQGGDPEGTGSGGPGYEILDDAVVGEYERGILAMARPANPDGTPIPNSQGSQSFICLDDLSDRLPKTGLYAIFGRVTAGMEVVDQIAATPNGGPPRNEALEPVEMDTVIITRP